MAKQLYVFNNRIDSMQLVTPGGKLFKYNRNDVMMFFDGMYFSNFDDALALTELTDADREDLELLKCLLKGKTK